MAKRVPSHATPHVCCPPPTSEVSRSANMGRGAKGLRTTFFLALVYSRDVTVSIWEQSNHCVGHNTVSKNIVS